MKQNRWAVALFVAVGLALLCVVPAHAGAGCGAGGGQLHLSEDYHFFQAPDELNYLTRQVIDCYLAQITGHGHARLGHRNWHFNREAVVAWDQVQETINRITRELRADVFSIPGRTLQYKTHSQKTGGELVFCFSEEFENYIGERTWTELEVESEFSDDAIWVGDPDDMANIEVLQGEVWVYIEQTDFAQDVYEIITEEHFKRLDYYAIETFRLISPLVLNLDGTGRLQASGGAWMPHELNTDRMAFFDLHGNGFPVMMEWVGPKDGLLCMPKPDGTIDGTCLFGTATGFESGYEALSALDQNGDWKVSGAELAGLKVWQDLNSNAKPEGVEVQGVEDYGITAINLKHDDQFQSTFVMNGQAHKMWDWWPNTVELRRVKRATVRSWAEAKGLL
jgi:hypothetical protein